LINLTLYNNHFSINSQSEYGKNIIADMARSCLIFKNPVMTDAENLARIKQWPVPRYIPKLIIMARPSEDVPGYTGIPIGYLPVVKTFLLLNADKARVKVKDLSYGTGAITGFVQQTKFRDSHKLRLYQNSIAGQIFDSRRAQAISMTGSGKTIIMAHVILTKQMPAVILCHRRLLVKQWAKAFSFLSDGAITPYTLVSGKVTKGNCKILISTFQSIGEYSEKSERTLLSKQHYDPLLRIKLASLPVPDSNMLKEKHLATLAKQGLALREFDKLALIIDEAHVAPAFAYFNIANAFTPSILYGCTATPFRKDGRSIFANALFTTKTFETDTKSVLGYLAKMRYISVNINSYFQEKEIISAMTAESVVLDSEHLKLVVGDPLRYSVLLETIKIIASKNLSCAVICGNNLWLVELLKDALDASGIASKCILGETSAADREAAIADTLTKKNLILLATSTLDEGVDIPSLDAVVFAVPFSSKIVAIQRAGRVSRLAPGKIKGLVIDFADELIPRLMLTHHIRKRHVVTAFAIREAFKTDLTDLINLI